MLETKNINISKATLFGESQADLHSNKDNTKTSTYCKNNFIILLLFRKQRSTARYT